MPQRVQSYSDAPSNNAVTVYVDDLRGSTYMQAVAQIPTQCRVRVVVTCCAWSTRFLVALARDRHSSQRDIELMLAQKGEGFESGANNAAPALAIIGALAPCGSCVLPIPIAASCILGSRRIQVGELARVCEMPRRTIEAQLRTAGWPTARDILGWMLALHTIWRIEVLRLHPKQVAAAAGVSDPGKLALYIARHAGARPRELAANEGFAGLLQRCVATMSPTSVCGRCVVQRANGGDLSRKERPQLPTLYSA